MKRSKKPTVEAQPEPVQAKPLPWPTLFRCQRSPVLRSQLLTALMAGTPFQVERLPDATLLDVVLLASASRTYCEAEIVDNFEDLLRRTDAKWREPNFTNRMMDSVHSSTASFITMRGEVNGEEFDMPEISYIPALVGWYINHEVPNYFSKELAA